MEYFPVENASVPTHLFSDIGCGGEETGRWGIVKKKMSMRTYVIGISGLSGSGKSTFSEDLKECLSDLKVAVIHMDRYYKEESLRPKIKGIFDGKEYIDDNHPMALDLDRCYRDIQEAIHAEYDILIVEGFFSFYDTRIFNLLDFKIFVDCDADERAGKIGRASCRERV